MNRVIRGRKLNTFTRFAFQRYYIKGNLTKVSSFIDSSSSVKWKLCRNWLLRSFWPCEKAMCSLPLQKMSVKKILYFHHVPLFRIPQITYVNCWRNDLQNDVKFCLGKCFLVTQETLLSSARKERAHTDKIFLDIIYLKSEASESVQFSTCYDPIHRS